MRRNSTLFVPSSHLAAIPIIPRNDKVELWQKKTGSDLRPMIGQIRDDSVVQNIVIRVCLPDMLEGKVARQSRKYRTDAR